MKGKATTKQAVCYCLFPHSITVFTRQKITGLHQTNSSNKSSNSQFISLSLSLPPPVLSSSSLFTNLPHYRHLRPSKLTPKPKFKSSITMAMNQRIRQNHLGAATMAISFAILVIIIGGAESRDLRPSDHGLPFQSNYPARSPEMALFFGEELSPPAKRPPARPTILGNSSSAVPDSWWKGREEDRVRKALMVATVVCGGTGVVLLAAAAVLFAVHFRRQRAISSTYSAPGNNNNSTAIVVAAPSPTTITK